MIDQTPYIGSRPMPLDTKQRRLEARASSGGTFAGVLIVAAIITGPIVWHLAHVLPALLWGQP